MSKNDKAFIASCTGNILVAGNNPVIPFNQVLDIDAWNELLKKVHYVIAYFIHANDLSDSEAEEDIEFALDQFAKKHGLPEHDWDAEYEEQYGNHDDI